MSEKHLLLIDLGSVFYQAWHATSPAEPAGRPHDVAVERVRRIAGNRRSHVAVCADAPRNWRYGLAPAYKANRESKTEACIAQLRRVCETLRLDGFPVWLCDGFEADDVIATATREALAASLLVTIYTADKDMAQLVCDGVSIRSVKTGLDMAAPEVVAKFGVRPDQMGDWLALVGDASDNVPGVPGIGAKRAAELLGTWNSLVPLMAAVEDPEDASVPDALRAKLLQHREQLTLSRRLVALRDDAPIDFAAALIERVTSPLQGTESTDYEENDVNNDPTNDNEIHDAQVEEIPRPADSESRRIEPSDVAVEAMSQPTAAQSHAITLVRPGSDEWSLALEPMNAPDAWKLAGHLFNSRVFGAFPNQAAVFAAVMLGRTLGVPAATIARSVHIVEGRMTLSAQFIVGLVLKSGKATYFKCVDSSPTKAVWKTHRKGDPDPQATVVTWTIEDARAAGLIKPKGNWEKYPAVMLRWRAATDLARMVFPDIIGGLYTPDELDAEHASVSGQVAA